MRVQATFRSRIGRLTSGLVLPLIGAAIAGLAMSNTTLAESAYPAKSIKLIVGFAPGGPTDILARVIGKGMADILGEQMIVENRAGAAAISPPKRPRVRRPTATRCN